MTNHFFHKKFVGCLSFFLCLFAAGQTRIIDSLKKAIPLEQDHRQITRTVFLLCDQYRSLHPDTLLNYIKMAEGYAQQSNNAYDKLKTSFYRSVYLINKVQLDSASKLIDRALAAFGRGEFPELKNEFILLKSRLLIKSNKIKESIENSMQLLQSSETARDSLWEMRSRIFVGWGYMELGQDQQALNWFLEAGRIDDETHHRYSQPALYGNLVSVYVNLSKNDSALVWSERSINLSKQKEDLTSLANALFINAGIYIQIHENQRAEKMMEEGLKIRKLIGDPFYIVSDIYQLGNFYAHNHEPVKGIQVTNEGIAIAQQYGLRSKLYILYTALAENYQTAGDYKNYSDVLNRIISLKDSIYTKNSADALSDIQTKYEVQKKQNIIIGQQLDLTKKNNLIFGAWLLVAATVTVSYVAFTARKKNQQLKMREMVIDQKKKTMDAVMQAEENERKRIAAELHDSVAQKMVVAKLNLEAFEECLPKLDHEQELVFKNIFSLVDESCSEVRQLSHSMMPHAFFQCGLTESVRNFIEKIENKNLRVLFNVDGNPDVADKNTGLMIYRVIQECMQNIIRHAQANKVDISLISENGEIDVIIEDNGVGFDSAVAEQTGGMGLKNIRSRIEFMNGELDINSRPGMGCVVAFYIPIPKTGTV